MSHKISSLLARSANIQSRIERARSGPDWITLLRLKLLHLRVKGRLKALFAASMPAPVPRMSLARTSR